MHRLPIWCTQVVKQNTLYVQQTHICQEAQELGVQARHLVLAEVEGEEEVSSLKAAEISCKYAISLRGTSLCGQMSIAPAALPRGMAHQPVNPGNL